MLCQQAWKSFSDYDLALNRKYSYKEWKRNLPAGFFDTTTGITKTGNWTRTNGKFLWMNWYVYTNWLHWNFSSKSIGSTKNGPQTNCKICKILWANQPVYQKKKITCINIFSIRPSEVQKLETGHKTGSRTNRKFLWMNLYENTNLPALEFFR